MRSVSTAICGVIGACVSLGLKFGGVLALPVAISVATNLTVLSALIGLIYLAIFSLR